MIANLKSMVRLMLLLGFGLAMFSPARAYKMPMPDDVAAGTEADQRRWIEGEMRDSSTLQQQVALERGAERASAQEQFATDQRLQAEARQAKLTRVRERAASEHAASSTKQAALFSGVFVVLLAMIAMWWLQRRNEMQALASFRTGPRQEMRIDTKPAPKPATQPASGPSTIPR